MVRIQRLASLGIMLVLLTVFSGCATLNISSRHNETAALRQYKTFACVADTSFEHYRGVNKITEAVFIDKLQELGMKYDSVAPDTTIFIQFKASKRYETVAIYSSGYIDYTNPEQIGFSNDADIIHQQDNYRGLKGKMFINILKNTAPKVVWYNVTEVPVYSYMSKEIRCSVEGILHTYLSLQDKPSL
jgi:hypothetical protein